MGGSQVRGNEKNDGQIISSEQIWRQLSDNLKKLGINEARSFSQVLNTSKWESQCKFIRQFNPALTTGTCKEASALVSQIATTVSDTVQLNFMTRHTHVTCKRFFHHIG